MTPRNTKKIFMNDSFGDPDSYRDLCLGALVAKGEKL